MPRVNHNVGHSNASNHVQQTNLLTRIEENTKNINVNVGDVEINVQDVEALLATTNTKLAGGLPSALTGSGHLSISIDEIGNTGSEKLAVNLDTQISQHFPTALSGSGRLKVESHITDHSKESKQDTAIGHLATVAGAVTGTEMQVDVVTMPTVAVTLAGGSTEAKQDDGITHLATIAGDTTSIDGKITACNTGAVVVSSSALPSGAATQSTLNDAEVHLGSIDGKITLCNTGSVIIAASALPSGAATQSTLNDAEVHLGSIDGKITACNTGAVVVSGSALPSGAATESSLSSVDGKIRQGYDNQIASGGDGLQQNLVYGRDNSGNLDALKTDASGHLEVVVDDFHKGQGAMSASFPVVIASDQSSVTVDNGVLTSLNGAINSNRVDVNIAAGGFDGAVTNAGLTALASCIGTDGDGSGPSKCISIAGTGVLGDIQEILVGGTGKLQVDISTSALPTGASTSALQGTLNTKIDTIDSQIDLLEGANTIKDVSWLSSVSLSPSSLSVNLDTEGYKELTLYGKTISNHASDLQIFGSSGDGVYYHISNLRTSTVSGAYYIKEDNPLDLPNPRYLKIYNADTSTATITLRATLTDKRRYV